jgi:hypothetical protein
VANFSKHQTHRAGKAIQHFLCAAVLAVSSVAQAGVLDFEGQVDSPFVFASDHIKVGSYWIESYGGSLNTDLVGAFVDGSDPASCFSVSCPTNNASQYYTGLDDGYFYFGMNDDSLFRLGSLRASFIGNGQASFPAVAGMLVLQGFNAMGQAVGAARQLGLSGPIGGQFRFGTFDLSSIKEQFAFVRVLGYACDATGNCNRNSNLANFAIDDIVTVPEPGSLALFGLGVAGLGLASRRRRVR